VKNGSAVYASKDADQGPLPDLPRENAHGSNDFDKSWEAVKHYRPAK
jgi:hypothetical protein